MKIASKLQFEARSGGLAMELFYTPLPSSSYDLKVREKSFVFASYRATDISITNKITLVLVIVQWSYRKLDLIQRHFNYKK